MTYDEDPFRRRPRVLARIGHVGALLRVLVAGRIVGESNLKIGSPPCLSNTRCVFELIGKRLRYSFNDSFPVTTFFLAEQAHRRIPGTVITLK